jgi:hypothetical protein
MLFRETVAVYCENHTEQLNTLCGQNAKLLSVKATKCIITTVVGAACYKPEVRGFDSRRSYSPPPFGHTMALGPIHLLKKWVRVLFLEVEAVRQAYMVDNLINICGSIV